MVGERKLARKAQLLYRIPYLKGLRELVALHPTPLSEYVHFVTGYSALFTPFLVLPSKV